MANEKSTSRVEVALESPPNEGFGAGITPPEERDESLKAHWKSLAACALMAMCPFQYGIDFGLIGSIQAMVGFLQVFGYRDPETPVGWNIQPERQQLISSLMTLGAFITSFFAGPIARFMGRKATLWVACVGCWVADVIMMTTTNIAGLYAGRLLIGLANGLLMTFAQLYIHECSPARFRGMALSFFQIWTTIGSLIGGVIDNYTAELPGRTCYQIPLGIIYIVPVIVALGMFFIPESPRWLVQHGKDEQAYKALRWLRPYTDADVRAEVLLIQESIAAEAELNSSVGFKALFADPITRRRTLLSIGVLSTQAASGAMYMIAYGTYFFEMANIGKPFENSVILGAVGLVAIIVNTAIITKVGRRRVFICNGLLICAVSQLFTAVAYTKSPGTKATGQAIVGLAVLYLIGYNGMVASYAWMSGGELSTQRLRSHTFGLATAIAFFLAWLTTFTAPYFINPASRNNWGPKYGYIWTGSCLIAAAWVYFYLPEVKGRTLEEIDEMFEARLPARKFRKYKCVARTVDTIALQDLKEPEVVHSEGV